MSDKKKKKKNGAERASPSAAASGSPGKDSPVSRGEARSWSGLVGAGSGERADKYIADIAGILSRSQIKARSARIFVNGKEEKLSRRLSPGDRVEVSWTDEPSHSLEPEKLDVEVLYEDENVFVFNKAQGMVTHPANGNWRGTLANAALWLDADRKGGSSAPRGGIVHRLDKDTSGVIIVARNSETHEFLAAQFKNRSTRKEYWAFVCGSPAGETGHIDNYLTRDKFNRKKFAGDESRGKRAITDYRVLARWSIEDRRSYALVALFPKTGRTHQLRVHMAGLGCPILGDPLYAKGDFFFPEAGLMLHARRLRIALPGTSEPKVFKAPLPERFRAMAAILEKRGRRL
ncbi:MAG TPA: RluA family pseudouridine synthase [Rectinemataceae bacterium]|nr:RluA family pseudouridine synthase [Rectinemataceae bacterium]